MTIPSAAPNPVITELVRNGVIAVTEEMKTNLMRTAYNMIIYEALDFTVGLFTAKGETISIGSGCPCSSAAWRKRLRPSFAALVPRKSVRRHPPHQRRLHHR